jgi:hypothetical protein
MSRNNQKPSSKLEDVLVPRQFELRLWDTWEAPSLILLLDGKDQRILRETFDIHWKDLDIHIRLIDECCGTGVAREQRVRRDKNVKVVYELNRKPEGIQVLLYIVAMTVGVANPRLDDDGYPRKLTFERMFPENRLRDLFNKANAFTMGMRAFKLALWAKEDEDEKTYAEIGRSLEHFHEKLNEVGGQRLTATVAEVTDKKPKKVKKAPKLQAPPVETPDDRTDETARKLTVALTGIDPGAGGMPDADETSFADVMTPAPVAKAAPAPAAKPKKEKPKSVKLGSPEGNAKLAELAASVGSNGAGGSNG